MASQRVFVPFDDFTGGESGTATGPNAPANSFTGLNVVPLIDGSIGPRCGLTDITPTSQSNGIISGFGWVGRTATMAAQADFFYIQGTHAYQFKIGGARSSAYTGTITAPTAPVVMVPLNAGDGHYVCVPGDKVYKLDHINKTITALTGSPGGLSMALYGTHLVVGSSSTSMANRIFFSGSATDDGDTSTWDALNFFDVPGDKGRLIRGLYAMRDYLLIVRHDNEMWRLSGTLGVNDVLRRVTGPEQSLTAFNSGRAIVTHDSQFWQVGSSSTAPQRFNGGSLESVDRLGTSNTSAAVPQEVWTASLSQADFEIPPQYAAVQPAPDSVAFFGNNKGLLLRDKAWSKHAFGQTIVGFAEHQAYGTVALTDGGGASAVPHFWMLNTGDERPPIKGKGVGNFDSIGDASDTAPDCHFSTNEWWDKQARRVSVRGVVVTFTEYDTAVLAGGDPDDTDLFNNFGVSVTTLSLYGANAASTSEVQTYNSDPRSNTNAGIRKRLELGFGAQDLGQGFKVNITDLRGIKIHSIVAVVDVTEGPPV